METLWFKPKVSTSVKKPPRPFSPELRHKVVKVVRSGLSMADLVRQFDVSRQTAMNWRKQNDAYSERRADLLDSDDRNEIAAARRTSHARGPDLRVKIAAR